MVIFKFRNMAKSQRAKLGVQTFSDTRICFPTGDWFTESETICDREKYSYDIKLVRWKTTWPMALF
jgi:hypothetical protein